MATDTSSLLSNPDFLAALLSGGGAAISAIGGAKSSKADRALQQRQLIANYLAGQQGAQRSAGTGTEEALGGPTGLADAIAHDQLRRQIIGGARNVSITPPGDIAQYMGHSSGGFQLPENGLDVGALSDESLAASLKPYLAANAQANPWGMTPDASALNLGAPGANITSDVERYRQGALGQNNDQQSAIQGYLNGSTPLQPNGSANGGSPEHTSFWHKLGTFAKVAAPIAASFIPGVGPIAAMAIGAGTNAGVNALQGNSIQQILTGAGEGAASGYLANKTSPFKIPRGAAAPKYGTAGLSTTDAAYLRSQNPALNTRV